jgi:hypothetical protein
LVRLADLKGMPGGHAASPALVDSVAALSDGPTFADLSIFWPYVLPAIYHDRKVLTVSGRISMVPQPPHREPVDLVLPFPWETAFFGHHHYVTA